MYRFRLIGDDAGFGGPSSRSVHCAAYGFRSEPTGSIYPYEGPASAASSDVTVTFRSGEQGYDRLLERSAPERASRFMEVPDPGGVARRQESKADTQLGSTSLAGCPNRILSFDLAGYTLVPSTSLHHPEAARKVRLHSAVKLHEANSSGRPDRREVSG
jgi:hypothetical protein